MTRTDETVYLVDDDSYVRVALSELIATFGFTVVSFGTAGEFLQYRRPDAPACVVLDLRLPDMGGLDLQQQIAQTGPPIIFISGHGEIPDSVRAMKAGALEFLQKPVDTDALIDAIGAACSRDRLLRSQNAELAELQSRFATLTRREREVLPLVIGGMRNKQAAWELGIAQVTLQVHRGQIMRKMAARSLPELVRIGERLGVAPPDSTNIAHS
ncbi:MAG TPA: response regulator [Steroidobacteraceae bacterium]|jgi:FixJ family two-component response regulator